MPIINHHALFAPALAIDTNRLETKFRAKLIQGSANHINSVQQAETSPKLQYLQKREKRIINHLIALKKAHDEQDNKREEKLTKNKRYGGKRTSEYLLAKTRGDIKNLSLDAATTAKLRQQDQLGLMDDRINEQVAQLHKALTSIEDPKLARLTVKFIDAVCAGKDEESLYLLSDPIVSQMMKGAKGSHQVAEAINAALKLLLPKKDPAFDKIGALLQELKHHEQIKAYGDEMLNISPHLKINRTVVPIQRAMGQGSLLKPIAPKETRAPTSESRGSQASEGSDDVSEIFHDCMDEMPDSPSTDDLSGKTSSESLKDTAPTDLPPKVDEPKNIGSKEIGNLKAAGAGDQINDRSTQANVPAASSSMGQEPPTRPISFAEKVSNMWKALVKQLAKFFGKSSVTKPLAGEPRFDVIGDTRGSCGIRALFGSEGVPDGVRRRLTQAYSAPENESEAVQSQLIQGLSDLEPVGQSKELELSDAQWLHEKRKSYVRHLSNGGGLGIHDIMALAHIFAEDLLQA